MQLSAANLAARGGACRQLAASGGSGRRQQRQRAGRRLPAPPQAGLFDDLFNFESWAPRSSQAWRLGNNLSEGRRGKGEDSGEMREEDVEVLNQRLAEARQGTAGALSALDAAAAAEEEADGAVFTRSTDEEVASALASRIAEVAATKGGVGASLDGGDGQEDDDGGDANALTGPLLRELMQTKWGKSYDLSFVRRDLPLGKTLICLNVMWTHLEQRSFPMTEEEYDEKLDMVALYLNSWGQAERVASFLRQPARPRKGMPSKPIVGTAISIQLDLENAVIDEFFAQGGA